MLQQKDIIDGITKHLDDLRSIVNWALLLAVLFWWAGINDDDPIKALGMQINKDYALFVAVVFYLVVNLCVWDRLYRIGDLLELLDNINFKKGVAKLAIHNWILNPFSYFGDGIRTRINSAKGFGFLIIVWWICNSSLYALSDNHFTIVGRILQGAFLLIGLASIRSIVRIERILTTRFKSLDKKIFELLKSRQMEKSILAFLCIGIGGLITYMTMIK